MFCKNYKAITIDFTKKYKANIDKKIKNTNLYFIKSLIFCSGLRTCQVEETWQDAKS